MNTRPLRERLEEKFQVTPSCWRWKAGKNKDGYGLIGLRKQVLYAHRVSYELYVGPIPEGLHLLHLCDNPSCVNPAHLRPGTQLDNVKDMHAKGRARKRSDAFAKITSERLKMILTDAGANSDVASECEIGIATLYRIKRKYRNELTIERYL
jgi:hypothetical protein